MRKIVLAGVSVCLGLLAPLWAGEIILRFLPVNEGLLLRDPMRDGVSGRL